MKVVLILVGSKHEYTINDCNNYTLLDVEQHLISKNLSQDVINKIKFIGHGNYIDKVNKLIPDSNECCKLYLFTMDQIVKEELKIKLFKNISNIGIIEEEINIESDGEKNDILSSDENVETDVEIDTNEDYTNSFKQFEDNDFLTLLKICLKRPELLDQVNSYLSNGNISSEIKILEDELQFKYIDTLEALSKLEFINNLPIFSNMLVLKSTIQHFNGNMNLIIRYLVTL